VFLVRCDGNQLPALRELKETAEEEVQDTSCQGSGGVPQL
jgi:hypothetical protein